MDENCAESVYDNTAHIKCKPFVKWAGGKRQLLSILSTLIPKNFNRYIEPFLGGGALYFALQPVSSIISDLNSELIDAYVVVRDSVEELINALSIHKYDSEYFYNVRGLDRTSNLANLGKIYRTSRFIYLNRTCFNGLYRVNSHGHFNVPFGRYANPLICDRPNLIACSSALKQCKIMCCDFEVTLKEAARGDFVYLDPPYDPLSGTSNFTSYIQGGFTTTMQERLRDILVELDRADVKIMLSNSATPRILQLYKGFNIHSIQASRAINSVAKKRGVVEELVITNY